MFRSATKILHELLEVSGGCSTVSGCSLIHSSFSVSLKSHQLLLPDPQVFSEPQRVATPGVLSFRRRADKSAMQRFQWILYGCMSRCMRGCLCSDYVSCAGNPKYGWGSACATTGVG